MGRTAPRGLRFFFDACFPASLARALAALDGDNEYLHLYDDRRFNRDVADTEWIRGLGTDQLVVSGDGHILRRPPERQVWVESRLRGFFLNDTFPNKPLWEQAKFVVDRWEKVLKAAATSKSGQSFRLPWGSGLKVEPWDGR